jgi:DNA-directed RNA polymerase subunit RPC12/RpoP
MQMTKFRGQDVEDRSNVDDDAEYRCGDCGRMSFGSELLLIVHRPLKEEGGVVVSDMSVPLRCNVRRCPYCRGKVVMAEVVEPFAPGRCIV